MGALGGVRPGGAFLGFEKGQSIMSGREGWGLSVKPSLAPSSSLRQGKGRRYLLLGLSWAQALGVYAEYIMRNAGLEEAQAGIKIARRNINTSDMQMTPPLWQKVKKN